MVGHELSRRSVAMLRAVAAGRARLSHGSEPGLHVDGLPCCDQFSSHELVRAGLIRPAGSGAVGELVPAEVTAEGWAALGAAPR